MSAIVAGQNRTPDWTTTTVTRGDVTEIVSVSGTVEATRTVNLSFPASGIVSDVRVSRGEMVATGTLLATIGDATLVAERQQAVAALQRAEAAQAELQAGVRTETRAVSETTIANARAALERTQDLAREQVSNALAALRSTDLEAVAIDPSEDASAPTVSGTYTCNEEGTYTLRVYNSSSASGYSYSLEGLEGGQFTVYTDQPGPLGSCGLFLQFTADESYTNTEWQISIPNTRSSTYLTRQSAYTLALAQAESNVAAARDAVRLAEDQAAQNTAGARVEALLAANAQVVDAQARIRSVDARLSDFALYAPFSGVITDVLVEPGETVRTQTAVTMLDPSAFEIVALIPEIDITRLTPGQTVTAQFDANRDEKVFGTITYVAPVATKVDGVGYFETVVIPDTVPSWFRAGLNADIDIAIEVREDVLRLPQRFFDFSSDSPTVLVVEGNERSRTAIDIGLRGNDGFVEVRNLTEGTVVSTP
jgi:HlyD family secretion protein